MITYGLGNHTAVEVEVMYRVLVMLCCYWCKLLQIPLPVQSFTRAAAHGDYLRAMERKYVPSKTAAVLPVGSQPVSQSETQALSFCIDSFGCHSVTVGCVAGAACSEPNDGQKEAGGGCETKILGGEWDQDNEHEITQANPSFVDTV